MFSATGISSTAATVLANYRTITRCINKYIYKQLPTEAGTERRAQPWPSLKHQRFFPLNVTLTRDFFPPLWHKGMKMKPMITTYANTVWLCLFHSFLFSLFRPVNQTSKLKSVCAEEREKSEEEVFLLIKSVKWSELQLRGSGASPESSHTLY